MPKRIFLILILAFLLLLILPNARALYEGVFFYLRDAATYDPRAVTPIRWDGRYAEAYDLARLRNAERLAYLRQRLDGRTLAVASIAIPDSPFVNLFVHFDNGSKPYTIFAAHYDKVYDDPEYAGASDNTAAVSVLLAAINELARRGDGGSRAFLFTGEEETGLRGARAFVEYARVNQVPFRAIVNLDSIGRGKLAIRPSAEIPGFVFTLPPLGDWAYDGRAFHASPAYPLANARLTQEIARVQPGIVVYERFTARSDSNVFQANGIDTVAISSDNLYYLELTWHTFSDRLEFLDERNLDLVFDLIMQLE
jgi:hypothetical protein